VVKLNCYVGRLVVALNLPVDGDFALRGSIDKRLDGEGGCERSDEETS